MYLFDASAIVNLIKKGVTRIFAYGATTDLALYESLNAVWKEFKLLKRIDEETALEYVDIITKVFKAIKRISIEGNEEEIFKLASKENLSIYDTSYLHAAIKHKLTLVTDDSKLLSKASKYVKVIRSNELTNTDKPQQFELRY